MTLKDEVTSEIKPGDDFYRFVNQKWKDAHPIPDDKAVMAAFTVLGDENKERLRVLLEAPADAKEPVNIQKLKQFYRSGMDEAAIEKAGLEGIRPLLDRAAALTDFTEFSHFIADRHAAGLSCLWQLEIA